MFLEKIWRWKRFIGKIDHMKDSSPEKFIVNKTNKFWLRKFCNRKKLIE